MEQINKETEIIDRSENTCIIKKLVEAIFSLIGIVLISRLIFSLLGANSGNGFVKLINSITDWFVGIFENIFAPVKINTSGTMVFEPATLIALIFVVIIAWFIIKLMPWNNKTRVEKIKQSDSL